MSVDPYAMCPCGSGKKLKFCCSDLVADIEKIHHMVEGDQPRAALQHAEQTLKKRPGRPSLLDLKAMLEVTLNKLDDAQQTVALLLEKDPENPAAHAQAAILKCAQGEGAGAVEPLQHALVLIQENMPRRVLEAIGAVGHTLLMEGNVIAARAHLWLYQGIAGREDTRALELLTRMNQVAGLPLLLRDHLYMYEAPAGHAAEDQHNYAQALAARGQWGPASAVFDKLCAQHPDLATLHYNRALLHGWLGDLKTLADGLRDFAHKTDDQEAAVEALAIAQLVDPDLEETQLEIVKLTYPVLDEEEVAARLSKNPLFVKSGVDPSEIESDDGPPPRAVFALLDRELPAASDQLTWEQTPKVVAPIAQFGRQTDRSERLDLVLTRDADFDKHRSAFESCLQGVVGVAEEEVAGQTDAPAEVLRSQLYFPPETPPVVRRAVTLRENAAALAERWPNTPLAALGGKTPLEAAQSPELKLPLTAAVLILEQGSQALRSGAAIAELRQQLGLEAPPAIDASQVDFDRLPLGRVTRLDLAGVADEDLVQLFRRATLASASAALRHVAREIVRRPSFEQRINLDEVYRRLVSLSEDVEESYEVLGMARARADQAGQSNATWDLLELELRIVDGDIDQANDLLRHIKEVHSEEPGVAEHLYELFYQLGAIPEDGQMPAAPPQAAPPAAEPGRIWTPDADQPAGEKKLWMPS